MERLGGGDSHLQLVLAAGVTELPPFPRLPRSRIWQSWQQGTVLLISLAATLFGAGLFLECFAEPGTVMSAGI